MSDISINDVQRIVNDGLREIRDMLRQVREDVHRVEQRTDDLDLSQTEIRDMAREFKRIMPMMERLARWAERDVHETQEITLLHNNTEDIKARVQNVEKYLSQLNGYLQEVTKRFDDSRTPRG